MRQFQVFRTLDHRVRDRIIFASLFSQSTQQEPGSKQSHTGAGNIFLTDPSQFKSMHDMLISTATVEITSGLQCLGDRIHRSFGDVVIFMKIADCPAVRDKMSFKSPLSTQFFHQKITGTAGLAVRTVVSAHNSLYAGLFHQCPESRQVGFFHILQRSLGVKAVPESLRAAVNGKMLGTGSCFQGISFSLQSLHKSRT